MNAYTLGYEQGRAVGRQDGVTLGRRLGRAAVCMNGQQPGNFRRRPLKVLYVQSGIGVPYPPIDEAIAEALSALVEQLVVVGPEECQAAISGGYRPDLMLALHGTVLPPEHIAFARQHGARTAIWFTDDPYYSDWTAAIATRYDYVFTLEKTCVEFYRRLGCAHVFQLPFAANPSHFQTKEVESRFRSDICFLGTGYWNRIRLIDSLWDYLSTKHTVISGWWWERLQQYELIKPHIRSGEWLSPDDTASYYNGAKIVINLHRDSADETINHNTYNIAGVSVNPRTFEINACQTLQLVDYREDIAQHYTPGKEIVCFHSTEELREQLAYYLRHEHERETIAYNGFCRTMRDHTYRHRLSLLLDRVFGA